MSFSVKLMETKSVSMTSLTLYLFKGLTEMPSRSSILSVIMARLKRPVIWPFLFKTGILAYLTLVKIKKAW